MKLLRRVALGFAAALVLVGIVALGRLMPPAAWNALAGFITGAMSSANQLIAQWQPAIAPYISHPVGVLCVWLSSWALGALVVESLRESAFSGPWHARHNVLITIVAGGGASYAALWVAFLVPVSPSILAAWGVGSAAGYTVGASLKLRLAQMGRLAPMRAVMGGLWAGAVGGSIAWLVLPSAPADPSLLAVWVIAGGVVGALPLERFSTGAYLRGLSCATLRALAWSMAAIGLLYFEPLLLGAWERFSLPQNAIWAIGGTSLALAMTGLVYVGIVLVRYGEIRFAAHRAPTASRVALTRRAAVNPASRPIVRGRPTVSGPVADATLRGLIRALGDAQLTPEQRTALLEAFLADARVTPFEPSALSDSTIRSSWPQRSESDRAMLSGR